MFGFQNGLWNPWGQNFQNPWQQNVFSGFNPFAGGFQSPSGNPFQGLDFSSLLGTAAPTPVLPPDIDPNAPVRAASPAPRLTRQEKINKRLTDPQAVIQGKAGPYRWGAR